MIQQKSEMKDTGKNSGDMLGFFVVFFFLITYGASEKSKAEKD